MLEDETYSPVRFRYSISELPTAVLRTTGACASSLDEICSVPPRLCSSFEDAR